MAQMLEYPKAFKFNAILLLLGLLFATVASVPTSVLAQNSELNNIESLNKLKLNNLKNNNLLTKVKRSSETPNSTSNSQINNGLEKKSSLEVVPASFNNAPPAQPSKSDASGLTSVPLPANPDLINTAIAAGLTAAAVEAAAAENQRDQAQLYEAEEVQARADEEAPTLLHKRGINLAQQQFPIIGDYTNSYLTAASSLPGDSGVWADELEPAVNYAQLQELDDYMTPPQRSPAYRPRAFDSLQSLNAETYLPYASRYYGTDRSKRSNSNKFNRYTELREKLTPADMLALVALVEAGERDQKEIPIKADESFYNPSSYFGSNIGAYDYPITSEDENIDEGFNTGATNSLYEPSSLLDYYGKSANFETIPKYEIATPREHKYGARNRFAFKRFMVAKKSRPLGAFLNEPVAQSANTFTPNQYF